MAFEEDVLDITLLAYADLSAYQYHFVKLTSDNTCTVCDGASDVPVGILQNKPTAAGQAARVRIMGVSRIYTGTTAITRGGYVGTDASGHGVMKSANKAIYLGISTAASASTETGTVVLMPEHTIYA